MIVPVELEWDFEEGFFMRSGRKGVLAWAMVALGVLGVLLSLYGISVAAATFAAGLVWYVSLAIFISGPVAGVGAAIAWKQPRQRIAFYAGTLGLTAWIVLWVFSLSVVVYRFP